MCGIFGIITKENSTIKPRLPQKMARNLFQLSETRGKEAAGLAIKDAEAIYVYKQPIPASQIIRSQEYKNLIKKHAPKNPITIIGHSRLVTDGLQALNDNNQPVIKDGIVGIHNGIIVNANELFERFSIKKDYEVDTEIILGLFRKLLNENKHLTEAIKTIFDLIEGSASIAMLFNDNSYLLLATNTGSLYVYQNAKKDILIFASERHMLKLLTNDETGIMQIKPQNGCLINIDNFKIESFNLIDKLITNPEKRNKKILEIINLSPPDKSIKTVPMTTSDAKKEENLLQYDTNKNLRRCTMCILPESFPGINFDENGVCNYCRDYKKQKLGKLEILNEIVSKHKNSSGNPDCLIGFSGGRDSSYTLHYVKTVLNMNPVAFTYDWGMVTDLARRNQARICGKLGIEHILVSADIKKKRENIKKNIEAWLKKPNPGTIPLFMAGDKQYFYYAKKIKKQLGINLIILGENLYEKTNFKTGFCGIKTEKGLSYALTISNKIKMAGYYLKEFFKNPSYFNNSLFDTLWAYLCYYFLPHNYINLYEYVNWDEDKVNKTLIENYNWETAKDTKTTWRIGDGTAPFYNYIYYTIAGFTENDTLRSNQIREGIISREKALEKIIEENKPRYDSIKWYCDIIGIDFEKTIKKINSIPKLYLKNL